MRKLYFVRKQQGFSLVELLVVIAIIGVLSSLIVVNLSGVRERGRDTQRKNDLRAMQTALRLYYNDYQTHPASNADGEIVPTGYPDGLEWGDPFTISGNTYMTALPADPVSSGSYEYQYWRDGTNGDRYCIWAILENASDQQIEETTARCNSVCGAQVPAGQPTFVLCGE